MSRKQRTHLTDPSPVENHVSSALGHVAIPKVGSLGLAPLVGDLDRRPNAEPTTRAIWSLRDTPPLEDSRTGASSMFSRMHALLGHCQQSFDRLDCFIQLLEETVVYLDAHGTSAPSTLARDLIADLNGAYCQWETSLEKRFLGEIDGAAAMVDDYRLSQRFKRLLERELALLSPSPGDRILFVGSGPLPISAIWAHRLSGLEIDCIDADLDAVKESRDVIGRLGLAGVIHIGHDFGQTVHAARYRCAIVALLAKPKDSILKNLGRRMRGGGKVVCRTSHGLRQLLYEPTVLSESTQQLYRFPSQVTAVNGTDDTISSLLLVRRSTAKRVR